MPKDHPEVVRIPRTLFITDYFHYNAGEHLTVLGPTGSGKTHLVYELLAVTTTPDLQGVVLVMKPRDATVQRFNKYVGYRRVRSWPPTMSIWEPKKPPGYTLWPKFTFDPDADDDLLYNEFRKCLLDSYRKGNRVIFGDEAYSLVNELGLDRELRTIWTKGRSMECGLWVASQKPTHIPLHAYNQAEHLFLHYDPDEKARKRFDEIGGVDPDLVRDTVSKLRKHEWLYIKRDGPVMAIVNKD